MVQEIMFPCFGFPRVVFSGEDSYFTRQYVQKVSPHVLTLLSAPDLYTASTRFRVAFPSEYSPKVYQSTELLVCHETPVKF